MARQRYNFLATCDECGQVQVPARKMSLGIHLEGHFQLNGEVCTNRVGIESTLEPLRKEHAPALYKPSSSRYRPTGLYFPPSYDPDEPPEVTYNIQRPFRFSISEEAQAELFDSYGGKRRALRLRVPWRDLFTAEIIDDKRPPMAVAKIGRLAMPFYLSSLTTNRTFRYEVRLSAKEIDDLFNQLSFLDPPLDFEWYAKRKDGLTYLLGSYAEAVAHGYLVLEQRRRG